ncbi:MAG TPA: tRNA epoxyqueuosine(34) reductase QueG [Candidatus Tenderia electrophaga]|uniref:Epoxyqueuosine reductase n=1 Tax=Candidatus Tenderia electrophaga TaxID=1748243 RepID=A0A832J7K9_9GAMM|nr:tRNA epoxyqueuosine(34) reductase QueG [Candidatus Tenderia electrophaga]
MLENNKLTQPDTDVDYVALANEIKQLGKALGFQQVGITDVELSQASTHLQDWLSAKFNGDMSYMERNTELRDKPEQLQPDTIRIISVRMDYLNNSSDSEAVMADPELGFISRYALGRDYHKLMRKRLQQLASQIETLVGKHSYRVFVDSAPVLEKALAEKAGLGWIGKHSNLLNREAGSWFFLGEIYTSLPLPVDVPVDQHCGDCSACIDLCPTQAIVAPYRVDARRCISYLTIELHGSIPLELRAQMGNRIYGCDDCQLVCPWNRFAKLSQEDDFLPRHQLDTPLLLDLFMWNEEEFKLKLQGSPIRRIGHERWLRNIAVALGNGPKNKQVIEALTAKLDHPSEIVKEHVQWALNQA